MKKGRRHLFIEFVEVIGSSSTDSDDGIDPPKSPVTNPMRSYEMQYP